jgi:hypothetical protein
LKNLLPVASKKDQLLWFRKFAVYYAVTKSNKERMQHYLLQMYKLSPAQTFVTVAYIIAKKLGGLLGVGLSATWFFIKLLLGMKR